MILWNECLFTHFANFVSHVSGVGSLSLLPARLGSKFPGKRLDMNSISVEGYLRDNRKRKMIINLRNKAEDKA